MDNKYYDYGYIDWTTGKADIYVYSIQWFMIRG